MNYFKRRGDTFNWFNERVGLKTVINAVKEHAWNQAELMDMTWVCQLCLLCPCKNESVLTQLYNIDRGPAGA